MVASSDAPAVETAGGESSARPSWWPLAGLLAGALIFWRAGALVLGVGTTWSATLTLIAAVAALAAAIAAWCRPAGTRGPWLALALGSAGWSITGPARSTEHVAELITHDLIYLGAVAAFAYAVLSLSGITEAGQDRVKLLGDLLPPVIAVATTTWLFLIGPFVLDADTHTSTQTTAAARGIGSAVLLVLALGGLVGRQLSARSQDARSGMLAVGTIALADAVWLQHLLGTVRYGDGLAAVGFALGFVAIAWASLWARRDGGPEGFRRADDRPPADWRSQLANLSLAMLLLLATGQALAGEPVRYGLAITLSGALAILVVVIARQSMMLHRDRALRNEIGALSERIDGLMQQVGRDPLTGLLNHRAVHERLDLELAQGRATGEPVAVVLIDVDNFKTVNDTLGHQAGDRVLRAISGVLTAAARGSDVAARYAGDEFMLLLPGLDEAHADHVCDRIANEVRRINRELALGEAVRVSLSVGVAVTHRCLRSVAQTVAIADAAMYDAKEMGKDQVVVVNADTLVIAELRGDVRAIDAMVAAAASRASDHPLAERRRAG